MNIQGSAEIIKINEGKDTVLLICLNDFVVIAYKKDKGSIKIGDSIMYETFGRGFGLLIPTQQSDSATKVG